MFQNIRRYGIKNWIVWYTNWIKGDTNTKQNIIWVPRFPIAIDLKLQIMQKYYFNFGYFLRKILVGLANCWH